MTYRPPESEYLPPSVYFGLGFSMALMLLDTGGSGKERLAAKLALLQDIADGLATTEGTPEEARAGVAAAYDGLDVPIEVVRTIQREVRAREKLAAAHLIEERRLRDIKKPTGE